MLKGPVVRVGNRLDRTFRQPLRAIELSAIESERTATRLNRDVALLEARLRRVERQLAELQQAVQEQRQERGS